MKIHEHARGRWPEVLTALIGAEFVDGKHHPCPHGEGKDRFRFSGGQGSGNYFCACSDGSSDGFDLIQCVNKCDFAHAAKLVESVIGECPKDGESERPAVDPLAWVTRQCITAPRSRYLDSRGLEMPECLRWAKRLTYFDADRKPAGEYAAMVAPVTRGEKLLTYHVTYLDGGRKADVDPARKILPGRKSPKGGSVALYPAGERLGIAEGIETAIAAKMLFDVPVWAALNTALLKHWTPPEGVKQVTIYADNDANAAGHAAAWALAHKLRCQGMPTEVVMPPKPDTDWNDMLIGRVAA